MAAENPIEVRAEPFDCTSRHCISGIGLDGDPSHLPHLECVSEHQEFCFGIDAGAPCSRREPCAANLDGIWIRVGALVTVGCGPAFRIHETGRADNRTAGIAGDEGQPSPRSVFSAGSIDVALNIIGVRGGNP